MILDNVIVGGVIGFILVTIGDLLTPNLEVNWIFYILVPLAFGSFLGWAGYLDIKKKEEIAKGE